MAHEDFSRSDAIKGSSDRAFGLIFAGFFFLVAFAPLLHSPVQAVRWWALGLSLAFAALALLWTAPLAPLNRLWLRLGLLLYKVVNPIVLGLLFFTTVMPTGLLMRALGKNPLRLRRDSEAASYWIRREPPGPAPDTMKNQF